MRHAIEQGGLTDLQGVVRPFVPVVLDCAIVPRKKPIPRSPPSPLSSFCLQRFFATIGVLCGGPNLLTVCQVHVPQRRKSIGVAAW